MAAPDILTYKVHYRVGSYEGRSNVAIGATSNHETAFGDIPTILAVSNGLGQHPELVTIISAHLVPGVPAPA